MLHVTEVNSFHLSTIVTKSFILDVCKGPSLTIFFFLDKKSSLIQFKNYSCRKQPSALIIKSYLL